jgi:DUF4097 and DUF4098 domain-containing protein YvlB
MEGGNRTVWIVIIVVALLALLCCCALAVGGILAGGLAAFPFSREVGVARVTESTEQAFEVGASPVLEVDNFAGTVTIRSGESEEIRVTITRRAVNSDRLNDIEVDINEQDDGLRIETRRERTVVGNMSVDMEISVPTETEIDVDNGAGNVRIEGVEGQIRAHTGAGNIRVEGAAAPIRMDTGAGELEYEGDPEGECTFQNGAGNIVIRLPGDVNAEVELTVGIGNINLEGFDVDGEVSNQEVDGTIGTGEGATIDAHTGAGTIRLSEQ